MTDTMREPSDARVVAVEKVLIDYFLKWSASMNPGELAVACLAAAEAVRPPQAVQGGEAVGWLHESGQFQARTPYMAPEAKASFKAPKWQPLYTHPAPAPAAVPAGYALVPVEPTPEMLDAGRWEEYGEDSLRMLKVSYEQVREVYDAMLSAYPQPPSAAVPADQQDDEDSATVTILRAWLVEADASCNRLVAHLRNVLEIARTWQPDYATHMDKETLRHAEEALEPAATATNGEK